MNSKSRCVRLRRSLIATLALLFVTNGCGFHLRGSVELPPTLSAIYVEPQQAPLITEAIKQAFTEQKLEPVQEKAQAQVVINVSQERYQRRVLSVGASGNVQEYELNYAVNLGILDAKGEPLADPQILRVSREMRYDSAEVVAKAGEEEQLKSEMIADAARQIIRRLQFIEAK
ncbi:LPS-assembly lipoprotein LptE [Kaarinaea lacus]